MPAFTTQGQASKRGRCVIAPDASVIIGKPENGERVGTGVIPGKDGDYLVHEHGPAQTSVPLYSVATAVASGKVIPFDALVGAIAECKQVPALKKALAAYEKELADASK